MITPNPPSPEPPHDDANRPRPPPDTRISAMPPTPSPTSEPFPVDEMPLRRRRTPPSPANVGFVVALLTLLSCGGGYLFFEVVCGGNFGLTKGKAVTGKIPTVKFVPDDQNEKSKIQKAGPP
jgi:hypothetical protein